MEDLLYAQQGLPKGLSGQPKGWFMHEKAYQRAFPWVLSVLEKAFKRLVKALDTYPRTCPFRRRLTKELVHA